MNALGMRPEQILPAESGGEDDKQFDAVQELKIQLIAIEFEGDTLFTEGSTSNSHNFSWEELKQSKCSALILPNEFYLWFNASIYKKLAKHAFKIANNVIENSGLDPRTKWSTVVEDLESITFKSYFEMQEESQPEKIEKLREKPVTKEKVLNMNDVKND